MVTGELLGKLNKLQGRDLRLACVEAVEGEGKGKKTSALLLALSLPLYGLPRWLTCGGLASPPGGVEILLAASCYKNWEKLQQL